MLKSNKLKAKSHSSFDFQKSIPDIDQVVLGKSRQVDALARKAISFQKRQMFTNICCITLCPLIMVAVAGLLGSLITNLIQNTVVISEYVTCSNVPNLNSLNIPVWDDLTNFPKTTVDKSEFPAATKDILYNANYYKVGTSCVYWFGEDYPLSELYERDPEVAGSLVRDTTFLAQPVGGWVKNVFNATNPEFDATSFYEFVSSQRNTWYLVGSNPSDVNPSALGRKDKQFDSNPTTLLFGPVTPSFQAVSNITEPGFLGTIPTRYYISLKTSSISPRPYYNITEGLQGDGIDDFITASLNTVIAKVAALDKSNLIFGDDEQKNAVLTAAAEIMADLPHGGIYFNKIDFPTLKFSYNFHVGSNRALKSLATFPGPGNRMLYQQTQFSNSILRNINPSSLGKAQITQGFRILPQVTSTKLNFNVAGVIGVILFPFGVSFLLPIFSLILIQEKEKRILIMMKMNGMKSWSYYLSHYITFFILYCFSMAVFYIAGRAFELSLFTLTEPGLLFTVFVIWGHNLISLAFFFSAFFSRSQFALVMIFLTVLCSVIYSLALLQIYNLSGIPRGYLIWPPFAFYRALGLLNRATYNPIYTPYKFANLYSNTELYQCLAFMIFEVPIFAILAYYFENVLPSEFSIRKKWHFPISEPYEWFRVYRIRRLNNGIDPTEEKMAIAITIDEKETQFEDADVKAERERVLGATSLSECPLVIKNMRKVYAGRGGQGPKLAVKDVTFAVERNIIFGLLGPNGAGKTTLISILTGIYEASAGEARIAGYNVKTQSEKVYKKIGICPQFDIQWDELTVEEHLYFYARLKGIIPRDEDRAVKKALQAVSLTAFAKRLTAGLSGGERRRVSIAIALLGNPKVVFFDEPTTGLDPEVRRLIWDIVNEAKLGRSIILTTHSMEEAEALCHRIGIMAKGTLRCHANPARLKQLYGPGFKIFINTTEEDNRKARKFIESILPPGYRKVDSFATNTSYEFPPVPGALSAIFKKVTEEKDKYGILDFGIGETSLEEVFLKLISEADASAEY